MSIELPPESQAVGATTTPAIVPPALVLPTMYQPKAGAWIKSLVTGNTYTFEFKLGEGFFSEVYACTDVWGDELAIKILKPRLPVEMMREAATREFTTLLQVRHPNVIHTFDAFEHQESFFIVTERCLGTVDSLFEMEKFNGRLWFKGIARCLLQAVHSLHVMGVAHQDIHLGNVMTFTQKDEMLKNVDAVWRFKLCDLGVARMLSELSSTDVRKISIMPPEVLDPEEFGPLDHRIDIYHAGLLLLQIAMSKRLEFTKEDILAGKPRDLALTLPMPFSLALEKALRRHVSYRTETAMEFWRDLHTPAGPPGSSDVMAGPAQPAMPSQ